MYIFVSGRVGAAGAYELYAAHREAFDAHFSRDFLKLVRPADGTEVWDGPAFCRFPLSKGGIFEGLWRLSEELNCGFEVSMALIPIPQEVIEVCEFAGISPYKTDASGAALIVTESVSFDMLSEFAGENVPVLIGETKKGVQKILRRGSEIRFLERPKKEK